MGTRDRSPWRLAWLAIAVLLGSNGCGLAATAHRRLWRTHSDGAAYAWQGTPPRSPGRHVYQFVAFGDSLTAGYDCTNPVARVRSYSEDLAIAISELSHNTPVRFYQLGYSAHFSGQILNQIRVNYMDIVAASQFIVWDAGGNDLMFARMGFEATLAPTHCRLSRIASTLATFRRNWTEIKNLVRDGDGDRQSRPDATIRAMNLYYAGLATDRQPSTGCVDPETGTRYANAMEAFLPLIARANWHMCNEMYVDGDPRLACADAFAAFNATDANRARIAFVNGESEEDYVRRIVANRNVLIDASSQQYDEGTLLQADLLHPSESGHRLLRSIHGLPSALPEPAATVSTVR